MCAGSSLSFKFTTFNRDPPFRDFYRSEIETDACNVSAEDDASRAIANATLTTRSFEIQLKGVPSITGRRTPLAPEPAASIKDRHGTRD